MLPEAGISCQSKLQLVAIYNEGPEMTDESNRTWSSLIQLGERFTVGVCVEFHTRTPYWDPNKDDDTHRVSHGWEILDVECKGVLSIRV